MVHIIIVLNPRS